MLLNCGVGEDSWESLGLQGDQSSPSYRKSVLNIHWKDWYWSWNSNPMDTWHEELTHWKRLWCWERLKVGEEGDNRGWDGWMASLTRWTWSWASSTSWWWTGRPGVLQSMKLQRVGHDWATELNWKGFFSGFPHGAGGKESACQCRRYKRRGFDPWVSKIPWGRAWQPTLVFLPGESHGQRSPVGYSLQGCKESNTTEHTCTKRFFKSTWNCPNKWERREKHNLGNQQTGWVMTVPGD